MPLNLPTLLKFESAVYTVAISRDGTKYLWAGGSLGKDCSVKVCSTATQEVLFVLKGHQYPSKRARFLPDYSIVSGSFDSEIRVWSAVGELVTVKKPHIDSRTDGFAFSSDGRNAYIADNQGEITGWNLKRLLNSFAFKENRENHQVWALALDPHDKYLVSGSSEGFIRVRELANLKPVLEIDIGRGHHIQSLAWHPSKDYFAAAVVPDGRAPASAKPLIALCDTITGKVCKTFSSIHQTPYSCAFSPDGNILVAGGGHNDPESYVPGHECNIHVWEVESEKKIATLEGHTGLVRDLAFSPDSSQLLSAGWDGTVRSWKL